MIEVFDFEWMNPTSSTAATRGRKSYFSNSVFAATGLPEGAELAVLEPFRAQCRRRCSPSPTRCRSPMAAATTAPALRRALALLREAGWTVRDLRLVNAQGQPFEFEILIQGATFERIALPYVQTLERLGIAARVRTVDPAQYQVRIDAFDYDMTVDGHRPEPSPGNEQRDYFSCAKARENGSQNVAGICDPVVDALIEQVINAPDRAALVARVKAMDRVLLWGNHVVPQWHLQSFRIAWWDKFGRPPRHPRQGIGLDSWWIETAQAATVEQGRRAE